MPQPPTCSAGQPRRPAPWAACALGAPRDGPRQAREYPLVDGVEPVPVGEAGQAVRLKEGRLHEERAARGPRLRFELQPRRARRLHLGAQAHETVGLDRLDPPEVERVARAQVVGVAPAAPHARPADQPVEQAAQPPEPVGVVPAAPAADAGEGGEHGGGAAVETTWRRSTIMPSVTLRSAPGPQRPLRFGPVGLDLSRLGEVERPPHRRQVGDQVDREDLLGAAVAYDDLAAQAFDQRVRVRGGDRGHEVHPVRRQAWREHRHRDEPAPQAARGRVLAHHVAVGQHVGAADLERAPDRNAVRQAEGEVVEHVVDGDRLAAGRHPARRDHDRQALGEVADHLERDAARADHDGGAKLGHGHARGAQDVAHVLPRGQMRRQLRLAGAEPAEVDDPLHAGLAGRRAEVRGGALVALLEAARALGHGVHQVVGHLDAREHRRQPGRLEHVAPSDLDVVPPATGKPVRGREPGRSPDGPPRAAAARAVRRRSRSRRSPGSSYGLHPSTRRVRPQPHPARGPTSSCPAQETPSSP